MKQNRSYPIEKFWQYRVTVLKTSVLLLLTFALTGMGRFKNQRPKKHKESTVIYPENLYKALRYRNIGPYIGGRSIAVSGVRQQPHTFYFGGTGGGLFKSTDAGVNWENISDKYFKMGSVGAIAVAPSDPNVVYVGMGESAIRGNMQVGDGVYKSTDGGKTWKNIGLKETHVISRIVVSPDNPNLVYVAALGHVFADNTQRGVYRSEDGGKTWKKILYVNDKTGAIDIAMDADNPRILYTSFWQAYRTPWILSSGGPGSGLYKSVDGGDTWKNISHNPGLPKGLLGKIGVTVSPVNPNRVWALVEAKEGGVFRSDDGGKTWMRLYHQTKLRQRAWYYTYIFADPKDENTVYATDLGLFKSVDGGRTFQRIKTPHGDNHDLWLNPDNPQIMIESNDGGANVSLNGGKTWSEQDQATGQFYHVAVDNRFPYHVYGPEQDNSSISILSRSDSYGITSSDWYPVAGGESGFIVPNPAKPYITYGGSYIGLMSRYNEHTRQEQNITVWPLNTDGYGGKEIPYRFNWTFPIMISYHNPDNLYACAQYVFKSTDGGRSWARISPDLTRNDTTKQLRSGGPITKDETGTENYDTIFDLAESPLKQGVLWAGSDDGLVHLSMDDGKTWKDVTPKDLPAWSTISIIEPSHYELGTAFMAARRYRLDDFQPYLYKTTDFGKHWTKIVNGIPDNQTTYVIRQDTKDKNLLFAGTDRGVWVSFNGGEDWQSLQLNLPHVQVRDMVIQNRENDLVLATHGRAFWIMDNLKPLRQMSEKVKDADAYLFQPEHTYLMNGYHFYSKTMTVGENPPNGAVIFYDLKKQIPTDKKVSLTFYTSAGDSIITFTNQTNSEGKPIQSKDEFYPDTNETQSGTLNTKAGMNRFVWNLRWPGIKNPPSRVLGSSGGTIEGPKVVPGTYKVVLTVNGKSMSQEFKVLKDPRNTATQADFEAQLALLKKIQKKEQQTVDTINKIISTRKQIKSYLDQLSAYPKVDELKKAAKPILDKLLDIQNILYQPDIKSPEDDLNFPVKLYIQLASLDAYTESSFDRPPKQMYDLFDKLSGEVDAQFARLKPVMEHDVPQFDALIKKMNIPAVYLKK